jgi:N-acetylglucosaminyl-diphospho-decaprenol L-rhamnosyltransferase
MKKFIDKITFLIVCFNSSYVIKKCIKSVNSKAKILIVENSNNYLIKKELEKEFSNVKVVIAGKNLGYGAGNNLGISKIKTPYAFIMNPDSILKKNCINELYKAVKFLENKFKILAPRPIDDFGFFLKNYSGDRFTNILPVDYVKGFAILINLKRINFRKLFDENFFLFLEEIDLCKRIHDLYGHKKEIFLIKKAKVSHVAKKSSGDNLNIKLCRDWHWMWSLYYYNKKHFGRFTAYKATVYKLVLSLIKIIFSIFLMRKINFLKYKYRIYGVLNAYLGKSSWLRPEMIHEK